MAINVICDADTEANALFASLTTGVSVPTNPDFTDAKYTYTPDVGSYLHQDPVDITVDTLTDGTLVGPGIFDKMMASVDVHIAREYDAGRITGDSYAEVYIKVMTAVLSNATQFTLTKDQSRWQAITAQMQARAAEVQSITALLDLEKSKLDASKTAYDMQNSAASYALTKLNLATAGMQHCLVEAQTAAEQFKVENVLPIQLAQEQHTLNHVLPLQKELLTEQVEEQRSKTLDYRRDGLTPFRGLVGVQKDVIALDKSTKQYQLDVILPQQFILFGEQTEAERAKTKDTRSDLTPVEGSIGKQKDLYTQQIASFDKDSKYKTAKIFLDSWITQKTLDEGLLAPTQFNNENVNAVINALRVENGL